MWLLNVLICCFMLFVRLLLVLLRSHKPSAAAKSSGRHEGPPPPTGVQQVEEVSPGYAGDSISGITIGCSTADDARKIPCTVTRASCGDVLSCEFSHFHGVRQ
jgi:hypothetical protein